MKKWIVFALCLLLTGCSALPRPREMENMALLRTLGVDYENGVYILTASTGLRSEGGRQEDSLILTGRGWDFPSALEDLKANSDRTVFLGYVDQFLVGEGLWGPALLPLLDCAAHHGELSLGARLWAVKGLTGAQAVESGGSRGIEQRLNTLRLNGAENRSAGEVYSDLLEGKRTGLPTLIRDRGLLALRPEPLFIHI